MNSLVWDGDRLRQARMRRGWSQDRLAHEVPTSVTNISRWERSRNTPSGALLAAVAAALGVDEGSFFRTIIGTSSSDSRGADGSLREAHDGAGDNPSEVEAA